MTTAVEMRSVSLVYRPVGRDPVTAVDAVSLSVPAGQVLGLLGPGGAGKTSLLRLLACLETPTSGSVLVSGYDTVSEREAAAAQVATALGDAPILLLDDATLRDGRMRARVAEISAATPRQTVVLATREPRLARDLCDRIAVVVRGRLAADLPARREADLSHEGYYEIEVKGRLDARRTSFFDGLDVTAGRGTTTISGLVVDQAALHGVLAKVRDLGLPLLSVRRGAADLEALLERLADSC